MSYNITAFKLKHMIDLTIPMAAFYKHERTDWHPEKTYDVDTGLTKLTILEVEITGTEHLGFLEVSSLDISGEGSGTAVDFIINNALKESKGSLVAVCVWEGGDTIQQLLVEEGTVDWLDIEL